MRPKPAVDDPHAAALPPGEAPPPPSKTRRKQAMHALQDLGEALVALDPRRLATLELPERFIDAILLARRTTRHEARRRQMQYIGRLMRDLDPEPIRASLASWAQRPERERVHFAALEQWRDRLLQEDAGLDAFCAAYPQVDRSALASLVAAARAECGTHGLPHKQRALFREIRRVVEGPTGARS